MKWREATQFNNLISSESAINNPNRNNNNRHDQQGQKTLNFTSKTQTILRQVWDSKFIFTKRSLVSYLRGRIIKSPDQNGRRPPATIKGYLAFQNQKIVQMLVDKMIAKQIFLERKIQTSGKRSKSIIEPMNLDEYYLIKNSNLRQKLSIQIPLSVIMNEQIRQKSGEKKQSRFSQFLVKKKQTKVNQDGQEFSEGEGSDQQLHQSKKESLQKRQKSFDLCSSRQKNKNLNNPVNSVFNNSKFPGKATERVQPKDVARKQFFLPIQQKSSHQQLNIHAKRQQQKRKQFWQRQNKPLFEQFGQTFEQVKNPKIANKNMQQKNSMIQMMKQIKQKERIKKINIPSQLFKFNHETRDNHYANNTNNCHRNQTLQKNQCNNPFENNRQRKQFILQNDLSESQSFKFGLQNRPKQQQSQFKSKNQQNFCDPKQTHANVNKFNSQVYAPTSSHKINNQTQMNQIQFKSPKNLQNRSNYQKSNRNSQSLNMQNIDQTKIFDYIFSNNQNQTQAHQFSDRPITSQQQRTVTLENAHFKNKQSQQNGRRSSANSSHSDSVRLKQYFESGQIGKFWDQIFENPKFNSNLAQKNKRQSQCIEIPQESQNTQTMTVQRPSNINNYNSNDNTNYDPYKKTSTEQLNNMSVTKTIFAHNLNRSFPQQANITTNNYGNGNLQPISAFGNRNTNIATHNTHNAHNTHNTQNVWRQSLKNNYNSIQQNNYNHLQKKNPYIFQIDSDFSDSFDRTTTIAASKQKQQKGFKNERQYQNMERQGNFKCQSYHPFQLQKFQIEYPPPVQQVQRSTYTLTIGQRYSDSFYYSPPKVQQQFYHQDEGQGFNQHTVTLRRNPFQRQSQTKLNVSFQQKARQDNGQYQNYRRYKTYDPTQQLQI